MRILPLRLNAYKPNFTSTTRTKYYSESEGEFVLPTYNRELQNTISFSTKPDVIMVNSNSTEFFRGDVPWKKISKIFSEQFPKGKVNIYDFACSDGSEAYSLVIALIEQLGEKKAQRFFPIVATDMDKDIITQANSGKIKAKEEDLNAMHRIFKNFDIKKYFHVTQINSKEYILTPKEILTQNVIFKKASIFEALDDVEKDENNIILARNCWKYIPRYEMGKTTWELANKSSASTLLMIGKYDIQKDGNYPFFLTDLGFDYHKFPNEYFLRKVNGYKNLPATKDFQTWQKFIESKLGKYTPNYIKR